MSEVDITDQLSGVTYHEGTKGISNKLEGGKYKMSAFMLY